jgi:hypothetical protein
MFAPALRFVLTQWEGDQIMAESLESFKSFIGKSETATDVVTASAMVKFAATLGLENPPLEKGSPIPPGLVRRILSCVAPTQQDARGRTSFRWRLHAGDTAAAPTHRRHPRRIS